jgi:hypothetical protein
VKLAKKSSMDVAVNRAVILFSSQRKSRKQKEKELIRAEMFLINRDSVWKI